MRTAAPLCKCGCGEAVTWFTKRSRWHVYVQGHYRSDADYKQREWLLMQYDVLQLTLEEIAAMFGVKRLSASVSTRPLRGKN